MLSVEIPVPLHHQLAATLRREIQSGGYKQGDRFATDKELVKRFGLSTTTVRRALQALVDEGYLVRKVAKGTFVRRPSFEEPVGLLTGFLEEMQARGIPAAADVLIAKQDPASQRVAKWLHLKEGEPAYFIKRLFRANGEPVAVQESWWPSDVGLALVQANLAGEQLLRVLADELGIYIGEAEATIEAGAATAEEASLLLVRTGSPVLVLKRVDYCTDGRPVVSERLVFRADKYKYQARQVRNPQRRVGDWA